MKPDLKTLAAAGMVRVEIARHAPSECMKHRAATPSPNPLPEFPPACPAPSAHLHPSGDGLPFRPQSEPQQTTPVLTPARSGQDHGSHDSPGSCESRGDVAETSGAPSKAAARVVENAGGNLTMREWRKKRSAFYKRTSTFWREMMMRGMNQ